MATATDFGSLRHLAERFFGALSPAGPAPEDERWATGELLPGERELWQRMSGPDRRHAVGVARELIARCEPAGRSPGRELIAAALLHDVGKVEARLGTFARVAVTLAAVVVGRRRLAAFAAASPTPRWRARIGTYLSHDRAGGELLRRAGSDPFTVAWAEQHHLDADQWTIDPRLGEMLKAADGS